MTAKPLGFWVTLFSFPIRGIHVGNVDKKSNVGAQARQALPRKRRRACPKLFLEKVGIIEMCFKGTKRQLCCPVTVSN